VNALIIVAHGSRRETSNLEILSLADKLKLEVGDRFKTVSVAFLELTQPSINDAVVSCFKQGANEVTILPYFLSAGNHVSEDVPAITQQLIEQWPDKAIKVIPHIGAAPAMIQLMSQVAVI
jgi:sirohydrochlorin ferrochelatase